MMNNYKQRAARLALLACTFSPVGAVQAIETCTVRDCHDGDTCTLICAGEKTKVRLHCIDAPEMKQAPWGENSRDALRNRLPAGSTVELQSTTHDRYGRTVGVLLHDGVNINLHQMQSGWAVAYRGCKPEPQKFPSPSHYPLAGVDLTVVSPAAIELIRAIDSKQVGCFRIREI